MLRKFVIIGDFNLKNVDWNGGNGLNNTNSLENEFVNGFADLGLLQCIDAPTHNKGKTLDILLTKSKQYITDLKIINTERYCISDHFAVTFKISQTVTRKPDVKRTCYNYQNAHWNDLNNDLNNIDWDITLDCQEHDIMWSNFKNAVFDKVNAHIPKFTIKSEHQPPWFDSECYAKCRDKDKLHKIYKTKKTLTSEIKFKTARKEFKTLIQSKMRANLDSDNRNILHKKFWFHVKSATKSTRIPEVVPYGGKTASDPTEKAKLFNEYFRRQFSEASNYSINIDFQNDRNFDIDFLESRIKSILSALNVNKAQGPDGINGAVLKHCSDSLVYPLSKMFNLIYNVGCIPSEWKTSNVVPIHKKDDKSDIENYRPISLISLVMKVFEWIIYEELLNRTEDKIDPRQQGFLRNKSCNTNLLSFTYYQLIIVCQFLESCTNFVKNRTMTSMHFGKTHNQSSRNISNSSNEIPKPLSDIINILHDKYAIQEQAKLNSVIINKFSGPSTKLPEHSINDPSINPDSSIFTLTIGDSCPVIFRDKCTNATINLDTVDNSIFSMSPQSQHYWTHKIDTPIISDLSVHYCVTFRSINRNNKNSTLIVGDSNTNHIYFSHEKKNRSDLGRDIYGRRVQAFTIDEIEPINCVGFQNIVIQVGLNNLKNKYAELDGTIDIDGIFNKWLLKVITIKQLCPYSRIVVSPIPPTRVRGLNDKARRFNALLFSCLNKFWVELGFDNFLDSNYDLLDDNLGRLRILSSGRRDKIHLGRLGISKLSLMIKEVILMPRYKVDSRSYSGVAASISNTTSHTPR